MIIMVIVYFCSQRWQAATGTYIHIHTYIRIHTQYISALSAGKQPAAHGATGLARRQFQRRR